MWVLAVLSSPGRNQKGGIFAIKKAIFAHQQNLPGQNVVCFCPPPPSNAEDEPCSHFNLSVNNCEERKVYFQQE